MLYRRKTKKDAWHFCANCQHWPSEEGCEELDHLPYEGRLCQECKDKLKKGQCQSQSPPHRNDARACRAQKERESRPPARRSDCPVN
jgi:hypothetical protein